MIRTIAVVLALWPSLASAAVEKWTCAIEGHFDIPTSVEELTLTGSELCWQGAESCYHVLRSNDDKVAALIGQVTDEVTNDNDPGKIGLVNLTYLVFDKKTGDLVDTTDTMTIRRNGSLFAIPVAVTSYRCVPAGPTGLDSAPAEPEGGTQK